MPPKPGVESAPTLSTMTEKMEISEPKVVAAPSTCPSVCTSVWDLRRPDGTAYPYHLLEAAAAILEAEPSGSGDATGSDGFLERNRSHGEAGGEIGRVGGWARFCAIVFAMVASGFVVFDRLLGSGMGNEMRHKPSPSATMVRKQSDPTPIPKD